MNKLHHTPYTHETEMTHEQTGLAKAVDLVESFNDDPLFVAGLERRGVVDETDRGYAEHLSEYVDDYLAIYGDEMEPRFQQEVRLTAETPLMIHVSGEIARLESKRARTYLPQHEWAQLHSLKPLAVDYNHRLSGYMNNYDDLRFSEVTRALVESALTSFPGHEEQVADIINDTARGARNEVGSKQLIRAAGIPFENTTNEGDLKGADGYIPDSNDRHKIDFKTSIGEIVRLNDGDETLPFAIKPHKKDPSIIYFPGITDEMYHDRCRLDDKTVAERAPIMAIYLQRAVVAMRKLKAAA